MNPHPVTKLTTRTFVQAIYPHRVWAIRKRIIVNLANLNWVQLFLPANARQKCGIFSHAVSRHG